MKNKENILDEEIHRIKVLMNLKLITENIVQSGKLIDDIIEEIISYSTSRKISKEFDDAAQEIETRFNKKNFSSLIDTEKDELVNLIKITLKDETFKKQIAKIAKNAMTDQTQILDKQLANIVTDFNSQTLKMKDARDAMIRSVDNVMNKAKNNAPELSPIIDDVSEDFKKIYMDKLEAQIGKPPTFLQATKETLEPFTKAFGPLKVRDAIALTDTIYWEAIQRLWNAFSKSLQYIFTHNNKNYAYKLVFKTDPGFAKRLGRFLLTGSTEDLGTLLKNILTREGFLKFLGTYSGAAFRRYLKLTLGMWFISFARACAESWDKLVPNSIPDRQLFQVLIKSFVMPSFGWAVPVTHVYDFIFEFPGNLASGKSWEEVINNLKNYYLSLEVQQQKLAEELSEKLSKGWMDKLNSVITLELINKDSDDIAEILQKEFGEYGYHFVGASVLGSGFMESLTITRPDKTKETFNVDTMTTERDKLAMMKIKKFMSLEASSTTPPPTRTKRE